MDDIETEAEKAYVFYVDHDQKGYMCVAMFLDATAARSDEVRGALAAKRLTGKFRNIENEEAKKVAQTFRIMELRARYNAFKGPYQVITKGDLERETLEAFIRNLPKEERKEFLVKAKV